MEEVYRKKMENVHQEILDMEYRINCTVSCWGEGVRKIASEKG